MSSITIEVRGSLTSKPATCNGAPFNGASGPVIPIEIRANNRAADGEVSQTVATIDSPAAYVALPFPSNLRATLLVLRTKDFPAGWSLRLTYEDSGAVVIPIHGLVLLEAPTDDRITAVEVQGSGSFAWFASGSIV